MTLDVLLSRGQRDIPRIVVTGIGALTPIGNSDEQIIQNLRLGRSGVGRLSSLDGYVPPEERAKSRRRANYYLKKNGIESRVAGELEFSPGEGVDRKIARRSSQSSNIGAASAAIAVKDSGLQEFDEVNSPNGYHPERVVVSYGTTAGGLIEYNDGIRRLDHKRKLRDPYLITKSIPNSVSSNIANNFGYQGTSFSPTAACASGLLSVRLGLQELLLGNGDVAITGASDSLIIGAMYKGFDVVKALSTKYNSNPKIASRSLDADRDGLVPAQGSATLILETLEHALARNARIHAEVLGYGSATDPSENLALFDGPGLYKSMADAIDMAQIAPWQIDVWEGHLTGTIADIIEAQMMAELLGSKTDNSYIDAPKHFTGHSFAAAGAISAYLAILSMKHGFLIPNINLDNPDPALPNLNYAPKKLINMPINTVLVNAAAFGGHCETMVFGKYHPQGIQAVLNR